MGYRREDDTGTTGFTHKGTEENNASKNDQYVYGNVLHMRYWTVFLGTVKDCLSILVHGSEIACIVTVRVHRSYAEKKNSQEWQAARPSCCKGAVVVGVRDP